MAQQNIWNPQEQYDLDPNEQYAGKPAQMPQQAGSPYDLDAWYAKSLGRGPNENERSTDLANISKYGAAGFESDFQKRIGNSAGAQPQAATSQYTSGGSAPGASDAALGQFTGLLQQRDAQQQQQQAALREILMGQLGQAQQPVSENSAGIREVLAGQRLGLQRGAERQRREAAEMRAYDGSGGLGGKAFETDVRGIQERQGEADAQMTGNVLGQELTAKREHLSKLLTLAMSLGDSESARTIQTQLQAIQTQLQQSNFYDQTAFNYAGLNQQGNHDALMAILMGA